MRPWLQLHPHGRGFVAGQTGTGKSLLCRYIIRDLPNLVILDGKCGFDPPAGRSHVLCREPRELLDAGKNRKSQPVILYRPAPEHLNTKSWNHVFQWIFLRRNTEVYIDEAMTVVGHNYQDYPVWMRYCFQQGRSLGISILSGSQRPSGLPMFMLTESEQKWKFFLAYEADQERMAGYMGRAVLEPRNFPQEQAHSERHSFFYRDNNMLTTEQHILRIRRAA